MSPKLLNILLIVSSAVLFYYVVTPLYSGVDSIFWKPGDQNIKSLIEKKEKYMLANESILKTIEQAKSLKSKYDSFDTETKNRVMVMVPESIDNIKLLSEMTRIANEKGIMIDGLGVKEKSKGEYSVSLSIIATYAQFKELIVHYEKSMRLLSLQSVSFSPSKEEDEENKFNVEFYTYYLK